MKRILSSLPLLLLCARGAVAQESSDRNWGVQLQATSIGQAHGAFPSLYEGPNSLPDHPERRVSLSSTAFLTARLGRKAEVLFSPEIAGGKGFGQVTGIAGFPNGEITRVAGATPQLYLARGYVRLVESGLTDATEHSSVRVTSIVGKFAITDFFDNNTYSHDPRTQFMNWSLMSNGAWDYPADTRGYTAGIVQELEIRSWSVRTACVLEPTEANGPTLDTRVGKNRGSVVEIEHRLATDGHHGTVRFLGYLNATRSGEYTAAIAAGPIPNLNAVQRDGTLKSGFGVNAEYELAKNVGAFVRYGWNDGHTESFAFTEIDRTFSGGLSLSGKMWSRSGDHIGIGVAQNGLSPEHRMYLADGGLGFILGDGALRYGPEQLVEAYYAWRMKAGWTVTGDYQRVVNPGYNQDRGPVSIAALRIHWEH
jgi:high affinity Mn2+ porin